MTGMTENNQETFTTSGLRAKNGTQDFLMRSDND
jgi:hypothetical protein